MNAIVADLERRYPDLAVSVPAVEDALHMLSSAFRAGNKLLVCGSGGSAADSDHIVGELMKGFELPRPISDSLRERLLSIDTDRGVYLAGKLQRALPAIALTGHTALSTAIANDTAGDMTFAQQVLGYGVPGDVLLALSTSGLSASVLNALHTARALGLRTIGMTGASGGSLLALCDVVICAPFERTFEIQERHLAIYHALCRSLELEFFG